MRKNFVICLALAGVLPAMADYSGQVFVDTNRNGVLDKGEMVMKDVAVSDGLNVVKTDAKGRFTLPGYEGMRFIFITTPSGYMTFNRHYIPVSASTAAYDFGLVLYNAGIAGDGAHKFVHITDTEIFNTEGNDVWVDNLRQYAANEKPAFIIHTGDICYENGLKEHIKLMNTENMGLPVFYCIGNHDLVKGKYGEELFETLYGPVYYSFDVAGVHYVVTPMGGGDHWPSYNRDGVARWLENDLAQIKPGTPVYVFNHDLLSTTDDFTYGGKESSVKLHEKNLKGMIYGHWHINHIRRQGDVMTVCSSTVDKGGIDHSTSAFRVMNVDKEGNPSSDLRYTYIPDNVCIASPAGNSSTLRLTVNAYSTYSPVKTVTYTCSLDGKPVVKKSALSQETDWTWGTTIPLKEAYFGKQLKLDVTATYANGKVSTASKDFVYRPGTYVPKFGDNWDNLLGNSTHTGGITTATVDSTACLAWTTNVGGNLYMASPLINGGKVYVATVDENAVGEGAVIALDGVTGSEVWKYNVRGSVKNSIAISDGLVFAQDVYGNLYAIDARSGELRWEDQLPVGDLPAIVEGLATYDGKVFAGTGKALSAYNAVTGKLIWRNSEWNQGEGSTNTIAVGDDVVVMGVQWSALYGNDARTGKKLWGISQYGMSDRGASAAIHGNLVYIVSRQSLFIIEARTGRIVVRKELPVSVDATSTPLLTDTEIIFGTARDGLMALDSQTLELKWNTRFGDSMIFTAPYSRPVISTVETSPILVGNTVFVAASDGNIYGVNRSTGAVTWQYSTGAPCFGSVAASGNTLIATDFGGNVYAFAIAND